MNDREYLEWCQKRVRAIINFYGHKFFFHKKILDLGCGTADIGGALFRLGSEVSAVDAQQNHLKIVSKKYNGIKVIKADLDQDWPFVGTNFDLTLDLALLCHLKNFEEHLRSVCASTTHLVLETAVIDSGDINFVSVQPDSKNNLHGSANGFMAQLSAGAIERRLSDYGMSYKRMDTSNFNTGSYIYNWFVKNNGTFSINNRRIWFCVKQGNAMGTENTRVVHSLINRHQMTVPPPETTSSPIIAPPPPLPIITSPSNDPSSPIQNSGISIISPPPSPLPYIPPNTNRKMAVVISGHLRMFEKTHKSFLKNILHNDPNKVDYFIHTWETLEVPQPKDGNKNNTILNVRTENKLKEIETVYNPKGLIIDKYSAQNQVAEYCRATEATLTNREKDGFFGNNLLNYYCMLYSWKQAFKLLTDYEEKNNFKYNAVIRYRTDLIFPNKIDWIYNSLTENQLYVPQMANYYHNGINDQFAFGDRSAIGLYHNLYDYQNNYIAKKSTNPLRPETLLRYHLSTHQVRISYIGMKYYILRSNGAILFPQNLNMATSFDQNLIAHLI